MNKAGLRKYLLEKRNSLSRDEVLSASESIIRKIDALIKKNKSMLILGFMPLGNEIDLRPLYEKILAGYYKDEFDIDITLGLPRVCGKEMRFFKVSSIKNLEKSDVEIIFNEAQKMLFSNPEKAKTYLEKIEKRLGRYDKAKEIRHKKNNILMKYFLIATNMIYILAGPIILMLGAYLLLEKFVFKKQQPIVLIIFLILGAFTGYWSLIKQVRDIK